MEAPRATVKEIARLAGVSIGTVDRVLHDRGEVSAATKAKIHTIIAALGYEPNMLARQLARNKVYTFRAPTKTPATGPSASPASAAPNAIWRPTEPS